MTRSQNFVEGLKIIVDTEKHCDVLVIDDKIMITPPQWMSAYSLLNRFPPCRIPVLEDLGFKWSNAVGGFSYA